MEVGGEAVEKMEIHVIALDYKGRDQNLNGYHNKSKNNKKIKSSF